MTDVTPYLKIPSQDSSSRVDGAPESRVKSIEDLKSELENIGISRPMLQAIFEYGKLDASDCDPSDAANAALDVITSEINSVETQMEMLRIQRNCLERKRSAVTQLALAMANPDAVKVA